MGLAFFNTVLVLEEMLVGRDWGWGWDRKGGRKREVTEILESVSSKYFLGLIHSTMIM